MLVSPMRRGMKHKSEGAAWNEGSRFTVSWRSLCVDVMGARGGLRLKTFYRWIDKLYFSCLYVYATFVPCNNAPKGIKTYVKQCSGSTCLPIKSMDTGGKVSSSMFHKPRKCPSWSRLKNAIYPISMAKIWIFRRWLDLAVTLRLSSSFSTDTFS